jgi:nicotinamide-nucleotide amidase
VTDVPGSSAYFDRGFVVYSNRAKVDLLGVPEAVLQHHGAVSEACARAMIEGLFQRTPATIGAAVTGIAGPSGGTPEKPVGSVWLAWGVPGAVSVELLRFGGSRAEIKRAAAEAVLQRLVAVAERNP